MRLLILGSLLLFIPGAQAAEPAAPTNSYCINQKGEFYPYKAGENCRRGYQLGAGNCRLPTGKVVAAIKEECARQTGTIQLPFPPVLLGPESAANSADPQPEPLTRPRD